MTYSPKRNQKEPLLEPNFFVLTDEPEVRDCNRVGQILILTWWPLIWACFKPKIAKTWQKVIVIFQRNLEEVGPWFCYICIALWINFFLKKVFSFFDIGCLQAVKWGQGWTKVQTLGISRSWKISIFQRFFKQCFSLLDYYLIWKLQQN